MASSTDKSTLIRTPSRLQPDRLVKRKRHLSDRTFPEESSSTPPETSISRQYHSKDDDSMRDKRRRTSADETQNGQLSHQSQNLQVEGTEDDSNEKLCDDCAAIDFKSVNTWVPYQTRFRVLSRNVPSSCPLCRFFEIVKCRWLGSTLR